MKDERDYLEEYNYGEGWKDERGHSYKLACRGAYALNAFGNGVWKIYSEGALLAEGEAPNQDAAKFACEDRVLEILEKAQELAQEIARKVADGTATPIP
jgi:hypothetical protein